MAIPLFPLALLGAVLSIYIGFTRFPHPVTSSPLSSEPPSLSSAPWSRTSASNIILTPANAHTIPASSHILNKPETAFLADPSDCNSLHATDSRGRIWSLLNPDAPVVVAHVGGTILGAAVDGAGGLYLADATKGLFHLSPGWAVGEGGPPVLVASLAPSHGLRAAGGEAALDEAEIRYCNDVAVDSATGLVYFSDSSRIAPLVGSERLGDTLVSYGSSHLSGDATGRLLVYDPESEETSVLVTGIPFANGVAVTKDGKHVLVVSTTTYSVRMFPVLGSGELVPSAVGVEELKLFSGGRLPGMPDGIWASKDDGKVYVPFAAPIPPVLRAVDSTFLHQWCFFIPFSPIVPCFEIPRLTRDLCFLLSLCLSA